MISSGDPHGRIEGRWGGWKVGWDVRPTRSLTTKTDHASRPKDATYRRGGRSFGLGPWSDAGIGWPRRKSLLRLTRRSN